MSCWPARRFHPSPDLAFASPVPGSPLPRRRRLLSLAASSQLYFRWLRAKNAADRQQARGNRLQKLTRAGSCPQLFCAGARKFPLPRALMRLCALCSLKQNKQNARPFSHNYLRFEYGHVIHMPSSHATKEGCGTVEMSNTPP